MKKILVLGAGGMAGHVIALDFLENGYAVDGFARAPLDFCNTIVGDARDADKLRRILADGAYDAVINCIGLLNQTAEDNKADAVFLNGYLPHFVARCLAATPARLIHMSTDCVFSGDRGGYVENSFPDGRTFYDRSKAMGEVNDGKNLTFRNSIVGPDCKANGIGLLNWFLQQRGPLQGYSRAIWTGVGTPTLARAMRRALETGLTGLYHLVNGETIDKFSLLGLFNRKLLGGALEIAPSDKVRLDKSLVNTRTDFDFVVPSYAEMVDEMRRWIEAHPQRYPHYALK